MAVQLSSGGALDITLTSIAADSQLTLCGWALLTTSAVGPSDILWIYNGSDECYIQFSGAFIECGNVGTGAENYQQAISTGAWMHLALVLDGTNARTYVNGSQVDSRSFATSGRTGHAAFNVGDMGYNTPTQSVQDVMLFTAGLTTNEVIDIMKGRIPRRPNLVGWWPLHRDTYTLDYSGRGQTLVNSAGTVGNAPSLPQTQWGKPPSSTLALRVVSSGAAIAGAQLETASATAAANLLAADVQTARDNAAAGLGGAQVGTGGMPAGSAGSANQIQTAASTAAGNLLAADVQTALMVVAGSVTLTAAGAQTASMTAAALAVAALVETASEIAAASLTGAQLETAVMSAATFAALDANNVQTAAMLAAAVLLGADVQTAIMSVASTAALSAADVQTASALAAAVLTAMQLETGALSNATASLSAQQAQTASFAAVSTC